ncbi:MAG: molybdopterin adenylyltransferase [Clostridiales bacterium]|jgi:molybdenum cofactor biosynthesis protein B|nr:molybdopterin adenylyltransferase [Clostridiales bacterium]MDN5281797.1 molybdopterin adenylyltransferase [Candidatus Ozemobacter sp.]
MAHHEHEKMARAKKFKIAVVTFTDTRDKETDKSGRFIVEQFEKAGHEIEIYRIVKEDPESMRKEIDSICAVGTVDFLITNGGTGLSARDNTIEVIRPFFDKELEGFGEIFRFVSFQQIGAAAILSRATAGKIGKMITICLPGSSKAVKLALTRIVMPQLAHMHWEANR